MEKLLVSLMISVLLLLPGGVGVSGASSDSRMLQEVAGPDQIIKRAQGLPVIISRKHCLLALRPESLFPKAEEPVKFTLMIENTTGESWPFAMTDLKVYSEKQSLEILSPKKIVAEARKKYSMEEYKINREQAKALAPYVENKMQDLRDSLLKSGNIPPGGRAGGLIFIDVPQGTRTLTIEVAAPGELHKFRFDVIEL